MEVVDSSQRRRDPQLGTTTVLKNLAHRSSDSRRESSFCSYLMQGYESAAVAGIGTVTSDWDITCFLCPSETGDSTIAALVFPNVA